MKPILLELNEMSDSREIMEHKIFPVGIVFIYMILVVIILSLIWSYFGEIDVVVKARGQIKPSTQIHTIKNKITGTVTAINIKNGDQVSEGDVLYTIDKEGIQLKLENANQEKTESEYELQLIKSFKKSVESDENLIEDIDNDIIQKNSPVLYDKLYNEYEQFKLYEVQSDRNVDYIQKKLAQLNNDLQGYRRILEMIHSSDRGFITTQKTTIYELKYITYMSSLRQKESAYEEKKGEVDRNKSLFDTGALSKNLYDRSVQELNELENDLIGYKAQFKLEVEQFIDSTVLQIAQYESELKKLTSISKQGDAVSVNRTSKLINLSSQIQSKEDQIKLLEESIKTLDDQLRMTDIKAPFSGYVNLDVELSLGDYLESGKFIGSVIPESGESFRLQLNVPNRDIADIEIGDKVKCRIDALPYKEYGMVDGEIVRIGASSIGNPDSSPGYYIVEAKIPNLKLASYKGEVSDIKVGMLVEGHIVTRTKKILFLLLEKLNFRS